MKQLVDQQKIIRQQTCLLIIEVHFLCKNARNAFDPASQTLTSLLVFFVFYDIRFSVLGFESLARQKKQFDDITLGFNKLWWTFLQYFIDTL